MSQLKQQLPSLRNNSQSADPDYAEIVRCLIEPFLESPESLRVDCEVNPRQAKAWIRLAFDEFEKGRVYGRGGRNIQAVRTVLAALAQTAGQSVHLEIYEDHSETPRPSPSYSYNNREEGTYERRTMPITRPSYNNREEGTYERRTMPITRPSYNRQRVSRSRSTIPSPIKYKRDEYGMR
ncbi:MAG: KH domain-containing protein [Cyanobacteriota bacterium]|nr:KH domain-containing protein [Cyanobacteriota bacterium]